MTLDTYTDACICAGNVSIIVACMVLNIFPVFLFNFYGVGTDSVKLHCFVFLFEE